ncbi:hypothetical protein BDY19DRAFT_903432 [Irpex rosettiformis]|uniref:Uncharacterized protein n=1 Tax=Irpex rosettiformis TaxID=378272 RepID=A0ACB8UEI5_9APHY|nr:hypothetical protein BDY19DRAFT_903432 [Irpex rosettiformis]
MSCWSSFFRCKPSTDEEPANNATWRTPQWPQRDLPPWTYSGMLGLDGDCGATPVSSRTARHRHRHPTSGILKERSNSRPNSHLPVHNPGISVRPENIPLLFPWTPGNGRPRSFVDPNPVVGETLANSIPTPRWQPINPWVGNSFVSQPVDGSGPSMLCTPLTTPGSLPPAVRPLATTAPATMVASLPIGTQVAETPDLWAHMPNLPNRSSTTTPRSSRQRRRVADSDSDDSDDDSPVIPVIPPTPGSFRSGTRPPSTPFSASTNAQAIPTPTGVWIPADQLGWEPHPCPDPMMHADSFWTPHAFSVPRRYWTPADYLSILRLTGGVPPPGTAPDWVSPAWPMQATNPAQLAFSLHLNPTLTPNPNNSWWPHLVWDVSEHPNYAKRFTGRDLTVALSDRFNETAVYPSSTVLHIYVDHHLATTAFWGPIVVKNKKGISVYDVLQAVFDYFQTPLKQSEFSYLVNLDPENHAKMCDSFQQRCLISRNQLPLFEREQGIRRIDTFGDKKRWWGVWITHKPGGTSYLNLGLVGTRRVPGSF